MLRQAAARIDNQALAAIFGDLLGDTATMGPETGRCMEGANPWVVQAQADFDGLRVSEDGAALHDAEAGPSWRQLAKPCRQRHGRRDKIPWTRFGSSA